jgi:hypothetical protein
VSSEPAPLVDCPWQGKHGRADLRSVRELPDGTRKYVFRCLQCMRQFVVARRKNENL